MESSGFDIIPLGVGNFFSTMRYCTCFLMVADGKMVLVDCPDPFFRLLAESGRKSGLDIHPSQINHIMLTHMHGDHSNGLEGLGFYKKYFPQSGGPPSLYTSEEVSKVLWQKLSVAMGDAVLKEADMDQHFTLQDYFKLCPFKIGNKLDIQGIIVETHRTLHPVPTYGFRATYKGRTFGYSCDTMFDPALIEFLEPCHLIFHECDKGIHTPLCKLEGLSESLRSRMRLVHLGDEFQGSPLIQAAEEGRVYSV